MPLFGGRLVLQAQRLDTGEDIQFLYRYSLFHYIFPNKEGAYLMKAAAGNPYQMHTKYHTATKLEALQSKHIKGEIFIESKIMLFL